VSERRILITDLNDTYPQDMQSLIKSSAGDADVVRLSMRDISGKDMYCSDEAYGEIRRRLSEYDHPERGIHFIDTGNYHYMSRIFTSFIDEQYDLVLMDNHTDMQDTAFGNILSCGSWAGEVKRNDDNLRKLILIGPSEIPDGAEEMSDHECDDVPVYLSIDKDILSTGECVTNWDQGNKSLDELTCLISKVTKGRRMIGADICGGLSVSDPGWTEQIRLDNTASDISIMNKLYELIFS